MNDPVPPGRAQLMSRIRGKNTRPEVIVRSMAHRLGLRFRLHRKNLPGKPDLIFPKYGTALFVHGCFWHQHPACRKATIPKTREEFWRAKLSGNRDRDSEQIQALEALGWRVIVVWECELKAPELIEQRLRTIRDRGKVAR